MGEDTSILGMDTGGVGRDFDVVLRGYDRGQVREHVRWLETLIAEEGAKAAATTRELTEATAEVARLRRELELATPSYTSLGHRVAELLRIAEEEADRLRADAAADATALSERAQRLGQDAERLAAEKVQAAEAAAETLRRNAENAHAETLAAAERAASARAAAAEAAANERAAAAENAASARVTAAEQTGTEQVAAAEQAAAERVAAAERAAAPQLARLESETRDLQARRDLVRAELDDLQARAQALVGATRMPPEREPEREPERSARAEPPAPPWPIASTAAVETTAPGRDAPPAAEGE